MGKKVIEEQKKQVEEENLDEQIYESDLVKLKKENAKKFEAHLKETRKAVGDKVDQKQVLLAVKALQKYWTGKMKQTQQKSKDLLLEVDPTLSLTMTLTQVPKQMSIRPVQVNVPHPFNSSQNDTRICIFVKDPEADFRKQIADMNIPCIAEVIGFDRLKRDFREYKDKRQLLKSYDLFLADIRIYKMLPDCLGQQFYQRKLYPCPIKVHGVESLEAQLNKAAESAYFIPGNGPNYSIKVGKVSQNAKEIQKNISDSCLSHTIAHVTCWDKIDFGKVSQISLKISSGDAVELPIYNHLEQKDIDAYMQMES